MGSGEGSTMNKLHSLYRSPNIVRVIKSTRLVGQIMQEEWKKEGKEKRPSGRPRRRWEDNINMELKEIGINTRNWVDSAHDKDYCRALVKAGIELPGSISHKIS